jgi:hypothetical protein
VPNNWTGWIPIYRVDNGEPARVNLASEGEGRYHGSIPALHRPARITYYIEVRPTERTRFPQEGKPIRSSIL